MIDTIYKLLKNRSPKILDNYRRYAVNIILEENEKNEYNIIFERRSLNLKVQPYEISLPGGKIENEETPLFAALRETEEELLISKDTLFLLGELDTLITSFNLIINPFVTINQSKPIETFNKDEVDSLIKIPLNFFIETEPEMHQSRTIIKVNSDFPYKIVQNGENYKFRKGSYPIYFYNYNGTVIWGITAKIVKNFIDIIQGQI